MLSCSYNFIKVSIESKVMSYSFHSQYFFIDSMQQREWVTIDDGDDDDEDDDDDGVKQEVTDTIEKFVQSRHVQTLKYLRHVIDENRHLRLHIEHLKRRQDDPIKPPAVVVVDRTEPVEIQIELEETQTEPEETQIELEEPSIAEILIQTSEVLCLFLST